MRNESHIRITRIYHKQRKSEKGLRWYENRRNLSEKKNKSKAITPQKVQLLYVRNGIKIFDKSNAMWVRKEHKHIPSEESKHNRKKFVKNRSIEKTFDCSDYERRVNQEKKEKEKINQKLKVKKFPWK